jgi:hypothetical protein
LSASGIADPQPDFSVGCKGASDLGEVTAVLFDRLERERAGAEAHFARLPVRNDMDGLNVAPALQRDGNLPGCSLPGGKHDCFDTRSQSSPKCLDIGDRAVNESNLLHFNGRTAEDHCGVIGTELAVRRSSIWRSR